MKHVILPILCQGLRHLPQVPYRDHVVVTDLTGALEGSLLAHTCQREQHISNTLTIR